MQEELKWRTIVRDAGTRWPSQERSSGVRRNVDTRGAEEREGPAVERGVKGAGRRRADVATACGRLHAVREVRRCDDLERTRPGGSRAARRRRRRPLRRKQWTRSGGTVNFSWRVWRWSGASRPWPSRRQRGRVWRGEAKAKVRTDLD
jgi:hypothetical protein